MANNLDHEGFQKVYDKMRAKRKPKIDPTDAKAVGAEWKRLQKAMNRLG